MSYKNIGEGQLARGMGLFNTDNATHDTNKYNITNKLSSHSEISPRRNNVADSVKSNSYHHVLPSDFKNTALLSPSLVSKVSKLKLTKVHKSQSRSNSRSSSSSTNSTGTVCKSEIFPYGKGIKPHQRRLRSTSPPSRTMTPSFCPPGGHNCQNYYDSPKDNR